MTEKTFTEGLALLLSAFPNLKPDETVVEVWRKLLNDFDDREFIDAVTKMCRDQSEIYPGTNIVATIRKMAGKLENKSLHPGPEEAWGIALAADNENKSVVWTDEIAQAQGACRAQLNADDTIGARMAFLEKYRQLIAEAEREGRPPKWRATLGFRPEGREDAQEKAALLNRQVQQQLAAPERKLLI